MATQWSFEGCVKERGYSTDWYYSLGTVAFSVLGLTIVLWEEDPLPCLLCLM